MTALKHLITKVIFLCLLIPLADSAWTKTHQWTHSNDIFEASFSPDGNYIAIASNDGNNCVYDAVAYQNTYCVSGGGSGYSAKFSDDQKYVAFGRQGDVAIYDASVLPTKTSVTTLTSVHSQVEDLHFNPESNKLITCGDSGYKIYAVPAWGSPIYTKSTGGGAMSCKFAKDNEHYAVGTTNGKIFVFNSTHHQQWTLTPDSSATIYGLDFSPDSKYLLVGLGSSTNRAKIYNAATGAPVATLNAGGNDIYMVDWNQDGSVFGFGTKGVGAKIYNGTQGYFTSQQFSLTHYESGKQILSFDFSGTSQRLVIAGIGSHIIIYDGPPSTPPASNSSNSTNSTNASVNASTIPIRNQQHCPSQYYQDTADSCRFCALDMLGCRLCNVSNLCQACTDQYYLDTGTNLCNLCINTMTACVLCSSSSVCTWCLSSYYLDGSGNCQTCLGAMSGCVECSNASTCTKCAQHTHFLNSTTNSCASCSQTYPSCISCDGSGCLQCQEGFIVDGSNACVKCPSNCGSCTSTTDCDSCLFGHFLSGVNCLPCSSSCLTCSGTDSTCDSCPLGYYLSTTTCLACDSRCSQCSGSAANCQACSLGYFHDGASSCSACGNGCLSCLNSTACSSCGAGHYLDLSSACPACSALFPSCLLCTASACLECSSDHSWNGTACQPCSSTVEGCQLCQGAACLVCSRGYFLDGAACSPCPSSCLTCSSNASCLSCPLGSYLDGSSCLPCGCPSCSSNSTCLSCPVGQFLSSGACLDCSSVHGHCSSCSDGLNCLTCLAPFFLSGTNCSRCSVGCTSCNASLCLGCDPGFFISSGVCEGCPAGCSSCSSSSNCSQCSPGYHSSGVSCVPCQSSLPGCLKCDSSQCLSCNVGGGFFLNSGSCILCDSVIPKCKECLSNTTCGSCQVSYAFHNSQCVSCLSLIPNCQLCQDGSTCLLCTGGHFSNGPSCSSCMSGCESCVNSTHCQKCIEGLYLNGSSVCVDCSTTLAGCKKCSSSLSCQLCSFGFFLDGGGNCLPCLSALSGCLDCWNSSVCVACESGFYLDSPTNQCQTCETNLSGCAFCISGSQCSQCSSSYYLSGNICLKCGDPNCLTCSQSTCHQCDSGFYLQSGACPSCETKYGACLFCNSTHCLSCKTGHHMASGHCQKCPDINCQVCNGTLSTQCLHCNTGFFLTSGSCSACTSAMNGCVMCSSNTICSLCDTGYYLLGGGLGCSPCNQAMPFCKSCSSSSICQDCSNGNILIGNTCHLCSDLLTGCAYCQVSSICLSCNQGFFLNSTTQLCERCTEMQGCLLCRNSENCQICEMGYFLQSGTCIDCNSTMLGCIACDSNQTCIACEGNFTLNSIGECIEITARQGYEEVSLVSRYVDNATLSHTLLVRGSSFSHSNINLTQQTSITLLLEAGVLITLNIKGFQWAADRKSIIFYTQNPFDFQSQESSIDRMKLFSMRRLNEQKEGRRLNSQSNFVIDANISLAMDQNAVQTILPTTSSSGALQLSYNINQPQFVASTMRLHSHYYHIFAILLTVFTFLFYFFKAVIVDPDGYDKGQLIPHILFLKTPVLMVYPSYAELINFCSGFMVADFPWLNDYFGANLSEPTDKTPLPYLLFYTSLSIGSTYILALLVIIFIVVVLFIIAYLKKQTRPVIKNMAFFFYNFFLGGVIFASVTCIQGALINFAEQYTRKSNFYILGFFVFLAVAVEAFWSFYKDRKNMFKIRVMVKATIISILHYNAIYLFAMAIGTEIFFMYFQWKFMDYKHPRLWLAANILVLSGLAAMVQFSSSLITIYIASVLTVVALVLEFIIVKRQFGENRAVVNEHSQVKSKVEINVSEGSCADMNQKLRNTKNKLDMSDNISVLDEFLMDEEGKIEVKPKIETREDNSLEQQVESVEPVSHCSAFNPDSHPVRQQLSPKRQEINLQTEDNFETISEFYL